MIFYCASNFGSKLRLRDVRDKLQELGHEVRSAWLTEGEDQNFETLTRDERQNYAFRDLGEISTSDVLTIDTQEESCTGGREVEFGFSLGSGKQVWRVGPERNVFHPVASREFSNGTEVYSYLETLVCMRTGS